MECFICGKKGDAVPLAKGLYDGMVIPVCESCAEMEGILLIKKPSKEQLETADRRQTVRETMERLSGVNRSRLNKIQFPVKKEMEKIKLPVKEQYSDELVPNYFWEIKIARRRMKISEKELARLVGVNLEIIERIEKGFLPKDYEEVMPRIEKVLGTKLIRENSERKVKFNFPKNPAEEKLKQIEEIRKNMRIKQNQGEGKDSVKRVGSLNKEEIKQEIQNSYPKTRVTMALERVHERDKISKMQEREKRMMELRRQMDKGELDLSKKDDLKDVTLNDLTELKLKKDKENLIGDEIEFDEE